MKKPTNIILLGPPGCGKGTQAKLLQKKFNLVHISTGDLLRQEVADKTELGLRIKSIMDQGLFPTNEEVTEVLENRMQKPDCAHGIIFDGYPRTLPQAEYLQTKLTSKPIVILVKISDEILSERILLRRSCPKCGSIYHLKYSPSKDGYTCDKDGEELIQRKDDTAQVLKQRLEMYDTLTSPLVDFYKRHSLLHEVVADHFTIDEIFAKILEIIERTHQ
ncbi:MAG: nucleoside monophosphate kinase [Chlamydiae bacterium]|nr:nucleoside monophosphate kinase [Chlamydiota bacterium]